MSAAKVHLCILLGLAAAAFVAAAQPAQALPQLAHGCTCPAGSTPIGSTACIIGGTFGPVTFAATCPGINQGIAHIAASEQQLSFAGVQSILEGRRDQLQGTLGVGSRSTAMISGYAPSDLDDPSDALAYAAQSRGSNPAGSMVYKAPPAPPASGPSWATWAQGLGDWEHDNAMSASDTAHYAATAAAQGGFDATWQGLFASDDALVVGLVGSLTNTHVSYDGTPDTAHLQGPGIGIYDTYVKGAFSVDLTTKLDFLNLSQTFAGLAPSTSVDLTNAGVSGNMHYKVDLGGNNFVEPTGGFSFTRTMFGGGAAAIGLSDADTLRLQAGTRWGGSWSSNGVSIEPSLKTLVYSNVIAEGSSATTAAATGIVPTDQGKVRGEVNPDLNLDFGGGFSVAFSGLVRFGDGLIGGSANVNLRKQW